VIGIEPAGRRQIGSVAERRRSEKIGAPESPFPIITLPSACGPVVP
jgi:hypothetical protein